MGYTVREQWHRHYADGHGFRPLGDAERALLAEHAPVPAPEHGGRALDVGCGTGELAVHLASLGYAVDAVDYADSALERARARDTEGGVRWLRLDVERDDPAALHPAGYDLITLRLAYAFLRDRDRVLRSLGERLRAGGALVVITPTADRTPAERRDIALDEDEIARLRAGWARSTRREAEGLAVLVLRHPRARDTAVAGPRPYPGRENVPLPPPAPHEPEHQQAAGNRHRQVDRQRLGHPVPARPPRGAQEHPEEDEQTDDQPGRERGGTAHGGLLPHQ
ncbi:hypothetical protein GCM10010302_08250 [Streptomyces polychromogenes]|uniref:Methyltransferase type 12 domain-containing protein n=1 Tax=Streptomyces polychromogenes TaxID=67342 RepID=A0ABN0V3J6_9ACTN